ncbi:MAG TPA: recombinase family protein, partial [Bellilinea sp.]|nr:recombinase family protein [Bellilinea sp.]
LEDKWTLEEIAEKLHERGYHHRTGRPFIEILPNGTRRANISTISNVFHNWMYAGWVVSEQNKIPPKTIRGNWEPLVTTEEFECGLQILERRNTHRIAKRRHDYLLKGIIYYVGYDGYEVKLTGSTSNTYRRGGGTAYYCVPRSNVNFKCDGIDRQIPDELKHIQVDPDMLPMIRAYYTHDLAEKLGHNRPSEREQLVA